MDNKNIVISNERRLKMIIESMKRDGADFLQIISDFDRTLSSYLVDGKKAPALIALLRKHGYLGEEYAKKAQELAAKYQPVERHPSLCLMDKRAAMDEWWRSHFELLKKYGLSKKDIHSAMGKSGIKLRSGVVEFLETSKLKNIPVVIMSANGLGEESINLFLENINQLKSNVYIVSNTLLWDDNDKMIGVKEPIVHVFNKDETRLQDTPFFSRIEDRKNIILIGDNLGDVNMAMGFEYKKIIRIGFLNSEVEENLEEFKLAYDIVILNDGPFDYINELLGEIINN